MKSWLQLRRGRAAKDVGAGEAMVNCGGAAGIIKSGMVVEATKGGWFSENEMVSHIDSPSRVLHVKLEGGTA